MAENNINKIVFFTRYIVAYNNKFNLTYRQFYPVTTWHGRDGVITL